MEKIHIDTNIIDDTSFQIDQTLVEIDNIIKEIFGLITEIEKNPYYWVGSSRDKFIKNAKRDKELNYDNFSDSIKKFSNYLKNYTNEMNKTIGMVKR